MEKDTNVVSARSKPREKRYSLESVDGGWVVIRRLKHGESTERLDEILEFRRGAEPGVNLRVFSNWKARAYDFAHCIVDHNLGDAETGMKLDFSKPEDIADLDENIGDEIQGLINTHHNRVTVQESDEDDVPEKDPNS